MVLSESHRKWKPGELVPASGIYRILHARHRGAHEAVLTKGQKFPKCLRCGERARFETVLLAADRSSLLRFLPPPSVLLVEQEPSVHVTLKQILENEGYTVTVASSVGAALDAMRRHDFDAVITEFDLETYAAGLKIVQRLHAVTLPPVVIVSTAHPTVERLRALLGSRVDYLVFKPIDLDELKSVLSRSLARRAIQLEMTAQV